MSIPNRTQPVATIASSPTTTFAIDADDGHGTRRESVSRYASLPRKLRVLRSHPFCARVCRPFLSQGRGARNGRHRARGTAAPRAPCFADGANPPREPQLPDRRYATRPAVVSAFSGQSSAFSCLSRWLGAGRAGCVARTPSFGFARGAWFRAEREGEAALGIVFGPNCARDLNGIVQNQRG